MNVRRYKIKEYVRVGVYIQILNKHMYAFVDVYVYVCILGEGGGGVRKRTSGG